MAVDPKKLIAAINPELYCAQKVRKEVKRIVASEGYLKAAEKAELIESDYLDVIHTYFTKGAFALEGLKAPVEQHKLVYDATSQSLEPIYFWILDFINELYGKSEKLVDNFIASPGSGFFGEIGQKLTRIQEEGMKIMQTIGILIKSIINIIYDLKEFKLRLALYDDYNSKERAKKESALLSLKQVWIDNVDIKRGVGSINGLAQQLDFVTLRDAFMSVESLKAADKVDLNERVKRILKQRVGEFFRWVEESGKELRKRFEIEKNYLKSQINSVKLYARWAKPYLKTAKELEQRATASSAIVNAFNTAVFELVLLAEGKYDFERDVRAGELPRSFLKAKMRKYSPIAIIEFKFRSVPDRADQRGGYAFRGMVEVMFTSFALNEDELKVFREKIAEDDFGDLYNLIEGATEKSFAELQSDLDDLLGDDKKKEEKKDDSDVNPFFALFSFLKRDKKTEVKIEKDLSKGIAKDSDYEKVLRSQAALNARRDCRELYDSYKKAHEMPAFPPMVN